MKRLKARFALTAEGGADPTAREWRTPEGIVRIERSGAEVLVVEGYRGAAIGPLVARLKRGK